MISKGIWLSLFALLYACEAQVPFSGSCPDVKVKQDFDGSRYLGKWYENRKYFAIFELNGKCITAEYSSINDTTIKVVNTQRSMITNQENRIVGVAKYASTNTKDARLIVSFNNLIPTRGANYWVLDTDYNNYSVVFTCTNYWLFNIQFAWILTRQQYPSQETIDNALKVFSNNGVNVNSLKITNQENC